MVTIAADHLARSVEQGHPMYFAARRHCRPSTETKSAFSILTGKTTTGGSASWRETAILDLPVFRGAGRMPALGLDLGLVMGSSEVCATLTAAPPQPHLGNRRQGKDPEARLGPPGRSSNAPIKPESQSILSKIVARLYWNSLPNGSNRRRRSCSF